MGELDYSKEVFEGMIHDWKVDHAPEYDDLEIDEAEIDDEGNWVAYAQDEKCTYELSDNGTGNIVIDYLASR